MSDNSDKLDDLFKNRFDEVELPVSDKLLANIKQELGAPKSKRKFGFWIWLVCGLVVVAEIANISMPYFKKEKNEIANKTEIYKSTKVAVNKELNDDEIVKENTNTSNSLESKISNQQNNTGVLNAEEQTLPVVSTSTEQVKPQKVAAQNVADNSAQSYDKTGQLDKRVGEKGEKKQLLKTTLSTTKATKQDKSLEKDKNKNQEKSTTATPEKLADQAVESESKLSNTTINNDEQVESENKFVAKNSTSLNTLTTKENIIKVDSIKNSPIAIVKGIVADTLSKSTDSVPVVVAKNEVDTSKSSSKQETAIPKSFTFFVELNGGPSQSFRMLSPESSAIVKHRNASEKAALSYNASLDFGMLFKNKYQISTGFGIDNKAEQYYYKGHSAEFSTFVDSFYVYDSIYYYDSVLQQNVFSHIDSAYTEGLDSEQVKMAAQEKRIKNTYQYLKIPLMVGYRFTINEKWFITPNAGVVVNYLISGNSTWFDEVQQQYVSYNAKTDYRSLVFAARAKIDIGFNIKEKWSILLQPGYTRFLQSIYRKEDKLKHLPYSYDVNVGIRYTF